MNFLSRLFLEIKNSIFGPQYYTELIADTSKTGLRYLLKLSLVVGTCVGISLVPSLMKVKEAVNTTVLGVSSYYPQSLIVHVEKGIVRTEGVTEPYAIPVPAGVFKNEEAAQSVNALVIDTTTPFSLEYFKSLNTFALVQKNSVTVRGDRGEMKTYEIPKDTNVVIQKSGIDYYMSLIASYITTVAPFIYALIIPLFVCMYFFGYMLYGIYFGVVAYIYGRIISKDRWTYKTAYRVGLHAMTLPLIVLNVIDILAPALLNTIRIPFLFTLASLVCIYINTHAATPKTEAVTPELAVPAQ
jgi:hypothetical protein